MSKRGKGYSLRDAISAESDLRRIQQKFRGRHLAERRIIPHVVLHGVEHKSCGHCGSLKPLDQFNHNATRIDGLSSECRDCQKLRYNASHK